jgi:hypothetical protein
LFDNSIEVKVLKKTAEEQIKILFAKHSFPPAELVIPILEKTGKGQQELAAQVYDTFKSLADGIKEILGLKERNMKALAKMTEAVLGFYGQKLEPIELSDSKFSYSVSDCPMCHVGKHVSSNVKSKFCDLYCTSSVRAFMDSVLGQNKAVCTWNKALIKGARKCIVTYELVKTK